jgi:hypothetical protein
MFCLGRIVLPEIAQKHYNNRLFTSGEGLDNSTPINTDKQMKSAIGFQLLPIPELTVISGKKING